MISTPTVPAFLVLHAISANGYAQGVDAFWFADRVRCEKAIPHYSALRAKGGAKVTMAFCTDRPPTFWFGEVPK